MRISRSFHNAGRYYSVHADQNIVSSRGPGFSYERNGDNRRLTEFQGVLLLTQLARLEEQARRREQNATYLKQLLKEIPGVTPQRIYDGCTRHAYNIFMCRCDREAFGDLPRRRFLQAMRAEGIRCSGGYRPLTRSRSSRPRSNPAPSAPSTAPGSWPSSRNATIARKTTSSARRPSPSLRPRFLAQGAIWIRSSRPLGRFTARRRSWPVHRFPTTILSPEAILFASGPSFPARPS